MIIIPLLALLSSTVFAAEVVECVENQISLEATTLVENFAGKDCTNDMELRQLNAKIMRFESAKKFCKDCVVTPLSTEQTKVDKEKYAEAVVGEFKKELTYITQDLLKIRETSFKMDSTLSCNLDQLLSKTICNDGKKPIGNIVDSLKESLANELANTFKPNKAPLNGLLKRQPLECTQMDKYEVSDQGILAAKTKYLESLLTPAFFLDLNKQLKKDANYTSDQLAILKTHPIFNEIGNNPASLKKFANAASKAKGNQEVIKLMNSAAKEGNFSKNFASRCQEAISKVSTALKTIYCEDTILFSEDKFGLEKLNNTKDEIPGLSEKSYFKSFCLDLNKTNSENDRKSFNLSQFSRELNKNIPDVKIDESWSTFHNDTHRALYNADKDIICKLIPVPPAKSACEDPSLKNTQHCQMLKFLKEADKPGESNLASKESRESVNNIFRSMISGANVSPDAQKTLQDAGILPGGQPDDTKSAGYFYDKSSGKQVASSSMPAFSNDKKSNQMLMPNVGKKDFDTDAKAPEDFSAFQGSGTNSNRNADEDESNSKSNKFDDNEQNIVDRLLRSKKNKKVVTNDEKSLNKLVGNKKVNPTNLIDEGEESFTNGSFTTDQSQPVVDNTYVKPTVIPNFGSGTGKHAKIDPKKIDKDASFNEAKILANNRAPASEGIKNTTITLSKTDGGLNKIEIKVPDETILANQTPELETKIKEYLDKSGASLQGAQKGEAFIIQLGKYEVKVAINDYGVYVATCKDKSLHPEYLAFLSRYFTKIKERVSDKETMDKIIQDEMQNK